MSINVTQAKQAVPAYTKQTQEESSVFSQDFLALAMLSQAAFAPVIEPADPESKISGDQLAKELNLDQKKQASQNTSPESADDLSRSESTSLAQKNLQNISNKLLGKQSMEEVIQGQGEDKIVKIQQDAQKEQSAQASSSSVRKNDENLPSAQNQAQGSDSKNAAGSKDFVLANKGYLNNWNGASTTTSEPSKPTGDSLKAALSVAQTNGQAIQSATKPVNSNTGSNTNNLAASLTSGPTPLNQLRRVEAATTAVKPEGTRFTAPVAEKVKYISTKGLDKAEIILEPKGLGKMRVEISSANKEASILFKVSDEAAANLLATNLSGLKQEIALSGLDLAQVSIDYGDGQSFSSENFNRPDKEQEKSNELKLALDIENAELQEVVSSGVNGGGRLHVVI